VTDQEPDVIGGEPGIVRRQRPAAPPASLLDETVAWARAVGLGLRDTLRDVLDEGRKGAKEAQDQAWRRYDTKTKHRRKPRP
jgi:hypothetical protein